MYIWDVHVRCGSAYAEKAPQLSLFASGLMFRISGAVFSSCSGSCFAAEIYPSFIMRFSLIDDFDSGVTDVHEARSLRLTGYTPVPFMSSASIFSII